ncbi:MAG: carboxypeptidase-like regulatory domain-containing protein [Terracidiphilus sp.]|nr:carboxypeptidase-like regulatory domain-containing protein [Terracidiphilus sp.]
MRITLRWLLLLLLVMSGGSLAFAQSTNSGDIRGTVTDTTGAVVPGVKVTVLNVDTGVTKDYSTNQDGVYETSSIVAGNYTVTFSKTGFETYARGPFTLQVGLTSVNAQLKVGSETVQVIVNTDIPLLQTETGDQTSTLDQKSMQELPQIGQDWENFMILLPGTTGVPGGSQGATNPGQVASSNGNLPYSNVLADGASTTLSHSSNANPAIFETVDELQVSLSSFSAQYGIGGMIINQISKGGTSHFHGSAYDYFQADYLDSHVHAYSGGQQPIAFLRYHDFGASVGGPVDIPVMSLKKKAFFYFDYDQIVDHGAAGSSTQTVPTEAVMAGDFTTDTRTIYDPFTQTIAYDSAGNPYPVRQSFASEYGNGNKLPSSLIDSVANAFQTLAYPTPSHHISTGKFVTGTTSSDGLLQNNWYSSTPQSTPYRKFFGRLDYDITPNNRLTMSDTQSDTPVIYPGSVTFCPMACQSGDVDNNNAQITDVWNISSRMINEARIGYTDQLNFFADLALGKGYVSKLGWQFAKADTTPSMEFTNTYPYAWVDPSSNSVYKEHVFDPSDVVTMIRGKHILHFGGEMLIYRDDSTAWGNTNAGVFSFSGQYTQHWSVDPVTGLASADGSTSGVEYADMLLGLSTQWNAAVTPEYGARLKSPQVFVQDDYKLSSNLTINLGFRYQINHGWNEVHGNEDSFDPTVTNPAGGLGAYWYGNTKANGRSSLQANVFNVFLPRLGFSWEPMANTTFRGGIGLYSYNWSLDNYGSGMGSPFGSSGSLNDQTGGITPLVKLDGTGTVYGTGAVLPYSAASSAPDRFNGQNVGYNPYHTPVPKIVQYNLAVQRQFGANYLAEVSYVGSHGMSLTVPTDLNTVPATKLGSVASDYVYRPYINYGSITGNTYEGISNYNSLQASITKRMSQGFTLGANYVWSHFLDDQDSSSWGSREGPQNYQIANNPTANYGNSNFDMRHAVKARVVYALPFGRGMMFLNKNALLDAAIGGWQIAGTGVFTSGQPFMVTVPTNSFGNTGANEQHDGSEYPNWNPGVSWRPKHQSPTNWVNPGAFTLPADGTFGNMKRNSIYGPGYQSVNMSASKTFSVPWENIKFRFRADASNVFNHTSWGNPGWLNLTGSNLQPGDAFTSLTTNQQINGSAISGRTLQLSGRLTF